MHDIHCSKDPFTCVWPQRPLLLFINFYSTFIPHILQFYLKARTLVKQTIFLIQFFNARSYQTRLKFLLVERRAIMT